MKTIIANKRKVSILFDADLVDVKVTNVNICFYEENFGLLMLPRLRENGYSRAILDEPRGPRRLIMVRLPIVYRTFPLDACPPNFTPVEDPTFSSFSPGPFSDLILGFPLA
ncbi:hypothetical protein Peur_035588 [Populus x canadensis]